LFLKKELDAVFGEMAIPGIIYIFISLFFFIIFSNFIGLMPYIFTRTSHLSTTLVFILPIWLGTILFSIIFKYYNLLVNLVYILFQILLIFFSFFIMGYIFYKFYFLDINLFIDKFSVFAIENSPSPSPPSSPISIPGDGICSTSYCFCMLGGDIGNHSTLYSPSDLCLYWTNILEVLVIPDMVEKLPLECIQFGIPLHNHLNVINFDIVSVNPVQNKGIFTFFMDNSLVNTIQIELSSQQIYEILGNN